MTDIVSPFFEIYLFLGVVMYLGGLFLFYEVFLSFMGFLTFFRVMWSWKINTHKFQVKRQIDQNDTDKSSILGRIKIHLLVKFL